MKNKGLLTLGALIVLGALAYNYYNKKKGTGYANASGTAKAFPGKCKRCRTADGYIYVPSRNTNCDFTAGDTCLS